MKTSAAVAVLGALLASSARAAPQPQDIEDRDVDTKYPYKGPEVPIGDWEDQTINGNGKGFVRIVLPPAVKPATSKPTNNINVVSLSYFPEGINIHYQTPFGLGEEPSVKWGSSPDSLKNTATGNTKSYDRSPPCSVVKPITQCSQFFHDVSISGLESGQTYYYQIPGANGTTESDVLSFTTARSAGDKRPFSISVLNDMGYTNADETYVQLKKQIDEGSQFVIHGGDISYADDWNQGILACDPENEYSVCYNGTNSKLPGDAPIPAEYLQPLPEGEEPNQGSPRGGDMSPIYETNWDAWQQWMTYVTTRVPYMVLPGNHEVSCGTHEDANNVTTAYLNSNITEGSAPEANFNYYSCPPSQRNFTAYQNRFTMPGDAMGGVGNFWYSFDFGMVHFVFIDTETDYPNSAESSFAEDVEDLDYDHPKPEDTRSNDGGPFGQVTGDINDNDSFEQLHWFADDLANVDREATPWIVVLGHRPMYSSEVSGYQESIREAFQSTMIENGVDVYIAGHIHWYERMLPLTEQGEIDAASVKDNNTYYVNPGTSLTHIVNGAAGNVQSHSILGDNTRLNISQVLDTYHYGLINMTVQSETALTLQYIFADDGSVGDEVTLLKRSNATVPTSTSSSSSMKPTSTSTGTSSGASTQTSATSSGAMTVTTEVVTSYTTWCPGPTTFTEGSNTYTVTEATTLTITDCPCTVTRPVETSSLPAGPTSGASASASTSESASDVVSSGGVPSGNVPGSPTAVPTGPNNSTATGAPSLPPSDIPVSEASRLGLTGLAMGMVLVAAML